MKLAVLLRFLQKGVNKLINKVMKRKVLFFLFSLIFSGIYAQEDVRSGKIVYVPEFYIQGEIGEGSPYAVFGLKKESMIYVLTNDSVPLFGNESFEVAKRAYSIGDSVEISGHLHTLVDDNTVTFSAFEIESINILDSFSPENISGTYLGRLVLMPNPAYTNPCLPDICMGLECNGKQYILSKKGWFWDDYVEVGGIRYEMGDSVEIKGVASTHIDFLNRTYFELEIDTIRKIEKSVNPTGNETLPEISNIYYDAVYQNIVIRGAMTPDRLEVFDARGRCLMKVKRPMDCVSVARLPHGLYFYHLTTTGTAVSGKFVR